MKQITRHGEVHLMHDLDTKETIVTDDGDALMFMAQEVKRWCKVKGWWADGRTFGDEISLLHSELSEALEAFRTNGLDDFTVHANAEEAMCSMDMECGVHKPEGVPSEFADVLIRLLHSCAEHDIDLFAEYRRKMNYNGTRAYRHGGRAL